MKKKKLIVLIIITISFSVLSLIGTTYALFTKTIKGTKKVSITTGTLQIDFEEGNTIQLEDTRPTEDAEGLEMEPYTFTIENSGDVKAYYNISIKEDESNTLNNNYVRYSLMSNKGYDSGVRVMGGEGSSEFIIKSEDKIEVGASIQYSLRLWLDKDVDNSVQGQSYKAKVVVNGYSNKTENATEILLTQFTNDESIQDYDVNYTKEDSNAKENKMYVFHHEKTKQTPELIDYRYIGADPNNYVTFNEEEAGWRIIGIFTVEDENGKKEKRIKLIRKKEIGSFSWDNRNVETGAEDNNGSNDWKSSRIMKLLNPGYDQEAGGSLYWDKKKGICYSGQNNASVSCNFEEIGLAPMTQKMIGQTKWYLGAISDYSNAENLYSYERNNNIYQSTINLRSENAISYIALLYPSDFSSATSGGTTVDRISCLSMRSPEWRNNMDCYNNNYLFFSSSSGSWLLNPWISSNPSSNIVDQNRGGYVGATFSYYDRLIFPTFYLKSDVKIISGDGSKSSPFVFEI